MTYRKEDQTIPEIVTAAGRAKVKIQWLIYCLVHKIEKILT
jgi:hypothetical protein